MPATGAHDNARPVAAGSPGHGVLPHLNLVFVGHVDHGKSTLIGRLLFDTGSAPEGKYEQIQAACKAEGMEFEYAFLLDALLEEQAQNITMDTTRVPFRTAKRAFTIIDAPGHKEFLKNMITGAASADAAVLIVDAEQGVREQTRRHGYLLSLLGVSQVVVAVNKMDLVGYESAVFERVRTELQDYLQRLKVTVAAFVPLSAKAGEGLMRPSEKMPWYTGPTLVQVLEKFRAQASPVEAPLRVTVQDVYRFDARRIIAGFVESGSIGPDDTIEFFPGGKIARVKTIERWPEVFAGMKGTTAGEKSSGGVVSPRRSDVVFAKTLSDVAAGVSPAVSSGKGPEDAGERSAAVGSVSAGRAVAFTLDEEIFLERGNVGANPGNPPSIEREFGARIVWLDTAPLRVGETLPLRLGTQHVEAKLMAVTRVVDTDKLQESNLSANDVQRNQVAEVKIRTRSPLVFDATGSAPALRRFVLIRNGRIGGGGVIDSAVRGSETAENLPIPLAARNALLGHRGAVIWLTGLSGSGKTTLATAVERRLLRAGVLPVVLDGDILRAGLCQGLSFTDADRRENIRRAAEAALLVAEAGSIVITALISPFRADRQLVAERCEARGIPFAEVYVNASLDECERRDPKHLYRRARAGEIRSFTGISSPYEPPLAPTLELRTDQESVDESVEKLAALANNLAQPDSRIRYLSQLIGPESALRLAGAARGSSLLTVFATTFEYVVSRVAKRIARQR